MYIEVGLCLVVLPYFFIMAAVFYHVVRLKTEPFQNLQILSTTTPQEEAIIVLGLN